MAYQNKKAAIFLAKGVATGQTQKKTPSEEELKILGDFEKWVSKPGFSRKLMRNGHYKQHRAYGIHIGRENQIALVFFDEGHSSASVDKLAHLSRKESMGDLGQKIKSVINNDEKVLGWIPKSDWIKYSEWRESLKTQIVSQDVSDERGESVVDKTEECGDLQDTNDHGDAYEFDDSEFI